MKHIIFTRFMYDKGDLANERLKILKEVLIPCLHNQTNQNFIWSLMCKPHHRDIIKEYYKKDIIFFNDSNEFKQHVNEIKYDIQTRHDSDDIMCPNYVEEIQDEYEINKFRKESFLIEFQPMFYDKNQNHFYKFSIDYAKINSTSAFISICPQSGNQTIWDHQHNKWVGNVSFIKRHKNKRCVAATVHNHNSTTNHKHNGGKLD